MNTVIESQATSFYQHAKGIGFMSISAFAVSTSFLFGQILTSHIVLCLFVFLRFLLPAVALSWIFLVTHTRTFEVQDIKTNLLRAVFTVLSQYCLFYYFMHGSLLDGTLLFATSPLWVTILSGLFLKIPVKPKSWFSVAICFAGVVLVLKPDAGLFHVTTLIGMAGGLFNACGQLTGHRVSRQQDPEMASWLMFSLSSVIALVPLLLLWHDVNFTVLWHGQQAIWLGMIWVGFVILAITNQNTRSKSYSCVRKAASVTPFIYMAIVFSALWQWGIDQQVIGWQAVIGMALVIVGGSLILFRRV